MTKLFARLLLCLLPAFALSQTVPNGGVIYSQVWSTTQWINAWQSKADTVSPVFSGTPVINGNIQVPATGNFFSSSGALIQRFNDRVFIGAATANDGAFPNATQDWLTAEISAIGGFTNLTSVNAAVLTPASLPNGGEAFLAGAQTKNFTNPAGTAIGLFGVAIANNPTESNNAYAGYNEAYRLTGATGQVYAYELDTYTQTASNSATAYQQGDVIGLQIAAGASVSGSLDSAAAIQIEQNPNAFKVGMVFGSTAIGPGGAGGSIIEAATNHAIQWRNASGFAAGKIISTATGNNQTAIKFADGGLEIDGPAGTLVARFSPVGTLGVGAASSVSAALTTGETALTGATQDSAQMLDTLAGTSFSGGIFVANTIAAGTAVGTYRGIEVASPILASGAAIPTTTAGIRVDDITTGSTNIRGIDLEVVSGTGKYNIYSGNTATNYFNGGVILGAPAGGDQGGGTLNAQTAVKVNNVALLPVLTGTTGSIGGGALAVGACTSGTVTITGLTTSMAVAATPVTYPGDGNTWMAYTSAAGTAIVKVCAITAGTPGATTYNVRALQ